MAEATISIIGLLEFIGLFLTIVISALIIGRSIKRGYKSYIDSKINIIDMRVTTIEKEIEDDKSVNQREHKRLTELFDKIDSKLDRLIERKSA